MPLMSSIIKPFRDKSKENEIKESMNSLKVLGMVCQLLILLNQVFSKIYGEIGNSHSNIIMWFTDSIQ